ncbi:SDR family NAD(P)-dependent oxidoreductase [Haliangium ochraceum]|uniref:NAD-dependent epimerase/dehydratase n=1 Tax=Haliangium ochraceum (strain DSM 14365 / JCM 11303 / SMP-2) TaxID=502025 RepID=D0LYS7_HALO1|nr:SDR family NAD(P)-dependent oxidoreductase [Haliangium ochraceum]ACY14397.1 NAD-dependent epimerase/dehydratase [Haliangium ochraceum DSM 14365]
MSSTPSQPPFVAVTGGAGFIGSHTVDRLLAAGCRVVVLDNLSTGKRENLAQHAGEPRFHLVETDIADGLFAPLAALTDEHGPVQRIIHLAAQTSVVRSVEQPLHDIRINYAGTAQVLEYARHRGVAKVVLASSAAVYGDTEELPVRETLPTRPLSPYGANKLGSEQLLYYYSAVHGVGTTALRFFNVYGPRQDPKSPYSGVISIFADRAMAGKPLTIFGDGEQTRDFVYVGDVSRAVAQACLGDEGDRAIINIGTGSETTVNELARTIVSLCGEAAGAPEVAISHSDARPGEIARSVAAVERMRDILGLRAETELAAGLRETLAWIRSADA